MFANKMHQNDVAKRIIMDGKDISEERFIGEEMGHCLCGKRRSAEVWVGVDMI